MEAIAGIGFGSASRFAAWRIRTGGSDAVGEGRRVRVRVGVRPAVSRGSGVAEFEDGQEEKARWAGDDPLAKFVTGLIAIKPVYSMILTGAKNVMVRTAEKSGIPWKEMVQDMQASDVFAEKEIVENPAVTYPVYYTKPFHGYETGNLSWEAAFDCEPATLATWKRTFPDSESWEEAEELTRGNWADAIDSHHAEFSNGLPVRDVVDLGCSTASSSRFLADRYPTAQVIGLDLSPYFLAVAQQKEKDVIRKKPIRFVHANAECTDLPSKSFDVVSLAYVLHECPRSAVTKMLREAHRLLRPMGTLAITDQSPKSKVIQLHPALWTMMKSTEPWLDEFYRLDLEAELQECGFTNYRSILTDPRHFTATATAAM
ncbi:hypothetical protein Mapa_011642 [Marchantia paleacea]|nr:hypothetical protein Mapa_011642 [Marchantia paleacea]